MRHPTSDGGWSVRASGKTLIGIYGLLKDGPRTLQRLTVQKAIIAEARKAGLTTKDIVTRLVFGVGSKRARARIAVEWAEALEVTEKEARRLAG